MDTQQERRELNDLYSIAYEELRRLARGVLRDEYGHVECSPTTLVNEAWLKLAATPQIAQTSPLHFRHIAGRAMRQIMVDAARRRRAIIHGGGLIRVTMEPGIGELAATQDHEILALHTALEGLKQLSPRQADLVEARFFSGLSCLECAELLDISEATVMRDWRVARAWLAREIRSDTGVGDDAATRLKS